MRTENRSSDINEVMLSVDSKEIQEERARQIVYGWENIEKAAADIYNSLHRSLLEGYPIFLYRNTSQKSDLIQVVVVRNYDDQSNALIDDYGVGMITAGFTMLYPHIQKEYLETDLLSDLEKYKVEKKIIDTYKQIINKLD